MNLPDPTRVWPKLNHLWWLAPASLFAVVIGGTMLAAAVQTDATYRLYGTPRFISAWHVLLSFGAIVVFGIGSGLASATGRPEQQPPQSVDDVVSKWFWFAAGLTVFGYLVWFGVGLRNGFSLGTLREFLTAEDHRFAGIIRDEMFQTLQGVTTCTQFGVAAVPLGLWLYFRGHKQMARPVALLVLLAAVRALIFSERLAVIELLVPGMLIALRMRVLGRQIAPLRRRVLQLAPVLGIGFLFVFFGTFEYFRSWKHYQHEFDSYAQFTLWRVSGYYTTAHNNGAMALETQTAYPLPYVTLQSLWKFPGIGKSPLGYTRLTGLDPVARHLAMLEQYGTPELNNEGGLFQPALDFGLAGYFAFWCGAGFVAGRLYRGYLAGTLLGVTLYPLFFLAILETPRLLYLCYPRALPALVTLLVVAAIARKAPDGALLSHAQFSRA